VEEMVLWLLISCHLLAKPLLFHPKGRGGSYHVTCCALVQLRQIGIEVFRGLPVVAAVGPPNRRWHGGKKSMAQPDSIWTN